MILVFPIFGLTLYLLIGLSGSSRKMRKRFEAQDARLMPLIGRTPKPRANSRSATAPWQALHTT